MSERFLKLTSWHSLLLQLAAASEAEALAWHLPAKQYYVETSIYYSPRYQSAFSDVRLDSSSVGFGKYIQYGLNDRFMVLTSFNNALVTDTISTAAPYPARKISRTHRYHYQDVTAGLSTQLYNKHPYALSLQMLLASNYQHSRKHRKDHLQLQLGVSLGYSTALNANTNFYNEVSWGVIHYWMKKQQAAYFSWQQGVTFSNTITWELSCYLKHAVLDSKHAPYHDAYRARIQRRLLRVDPHNLRDLVDRQHFRNLGAAQLKITLRLSPRRSVAFFLNRQIIGNSQDLDYTYGFSIILTGKSGSPGSLLRKMKQAHVKPPNYPL